MNIGGFQKTSLLDYPDKISAIIWTNGCNLRCPFCYNKSLALGKASLFPEQEILSFLSTRTKLLEGIVISGGEPFLQQDLPEFLGKLRDMGYKIKVDTNGTAPEQLQNLLDARLVDYIAMDVKAPKEKYSMLAGTKIDITAIDASIELLKTKAPDYEFRTTFIPGLLTKEDIIKIADWLKGSKQYYLQQVKVNVPLLSSTVETMHPYSRGYLAETLDCIQPYFQHCGIRGL